MSQFEILRGLDAPRAPSPMPRAMLDGKHGGKMNKKAVQKESNMVLGFTRAIKEKDGVGGGPCSC